MFGNDSQPSVIYKYGAKEPVSGLERVKEQLSLAHKYRNKLTEIERKRRESSAETVRRLSPDLDALQIQLDGLYGELTTAKDAIKSANKHARKKVGTPEQKAEVKRLTKVIAEVKPRLAEAKRRAYQSVEGEAALAEIEASTLEECKAARAASGLYWGTYLQVEQSASQSRKGKAPPRFMRWTGDGKLAVQLQGGMALEEAFIGKDSRFRLDALPSNAWGKGVPSRHRRTTAWLRVGSDGRNPVWAAVPFTMHRLPPDDSSIKWVYLARRRVGCQYEWSLCLVLSRAEGWGKPDLASGGTVAVNCGWRRMPDGIRAAYWIGNDGQEGELRLSDRDVSRWTKANDLRGIRDTRFNAVVELLADWMSKHESPDWLAERTRHMRQWRAVAKLAAVVLNWRDNRFAGDETIFSAMEEWRKKDKHLYEWEANQKRKAIAWRDDLYRNFAADLSLRYSTVVLDDTDWKKLAKIPEPESDEVNLAAFNRTVSAPGRMSAVLKQRFAECVRVKAKNTTQRCNVCGELAQFDAATHLWAKCRNCGAEWDQDANHCLNLLAAASGPVVAETA